jgi:putative ABC transport system ATP-binding protein
MDNKLLECRNLAKTFRVRGREIVVLSGVEFAVKPGEIITITGRSGEGKSVLLWLLSGLDRPDSGQVVFKGRSLAGFSNRELARLRRDEIGIIFQNFNLVASWTAVENVESAMRHNGMSPQERRRKAVAALAELGLGDRLDNLPAELSIGQQQRVAIARTLANDPKLILADEPTGDVDPETAREIIDLLLAPVKEKGATLVVATHGNFPLDEAHRVLVLKNGSLMEQTDGLDNL